MPIKKLDETLRFLQSLYDTHQPSEYGSCRGNHEVCGFQEESPEWPCYFHQKAADLLGLPEVEAIGTREPSEPSEPTERSKQVQTIWKSTVEQQLNAQATLANWKE